jgi:hypothetical protein
MTGCLLNIHWLLLRIAFQLVACFWQIVVSSDDPGILRTTLTREYVTLAFKYPTVK